MKQGCLYGELEKSCTAGANHRRFGSAGTEGPTRASQRLNGSALGDGMDWMMRRSCSVLATSVRRIFPSVARIFNCLQFVSSSLVPSSFRRFFKTAQ